MPNSTLGQWQWFEGHDSVHPPADASGPMEGGLYGPNGERIVYGVWRNDGYADCEASSDAYARLIAKAPEMAGALSNLIADSRLLRICRKDCTCDICQAERILREAGVEL